MLDPTITGSYLRDLTWTPDTPPQNDAARRRLFEDLRARSFFTRRLQFAHCVLELGLALEDSHVLAWYQAHDLDGPWPGGDYVLESLLLSFDPGCLGARMDLELLPAPLRGFTAWKRRWGIGFPREPFVRRFPMLQGEYQLTITLRGLYGDEPTGAEELDLGSITLPPGHCLPGYGAGNDLMVRWADLDLYADHPSPPAPDPVTLPGWVEPYFEALDEALAWLRRWHHCPRSTSNFYHERTHAEGYNWNDRYQGFYLTAFVPAYRLSGEPRYFQACENLYNSILNNIVPGFWGGPTINQGNWGTGESLLHSGIITRGVLHLVKLMGDPELARPLYDLYAQWPRDRQRDNILINVVFPDCTEQRVPFVYNQVMSSVAAVWPLGHLFGDEELMDVAERMWHDIMLPGFEEEGWWSYVEGRPVITQHYDLVQKSDASLWLEYDRWAQDESFREVMRRSLEFSLKYCTEPMGDMLAWQPFYAHKWESSLALGKAGMALEAMVRLCKAGFEEFAEPARRTARWIRYMHDWPDLEGVWPSSWMCCHVTGPLLEAALAGLAD